LTDYQNLGSALKKTPAFLQTMTVLIGLYLPAVRNRTVEPMGVQQPESLMKPVLGQSRIVVLY
jgi:hypothetical protein